MKERNNGSDDAIFSATIEKILHSHFIKRDTNMKKTFGLLSVYMMMLMLIFSAEAFAAGSSSMPEEDTRPGIAQYNAGVKLMEQGKYEKAAKKFEAALKKAPNLAEAHNNLGYSLRKQGSQNFERALSHYNKAIELKPDLARAYMYRGVLHSLMGNEALALADHNKLTGLDRGLAKALQAAIASGEEPEGLTGLSPKW